MSNSNSNSPSSKQQSYAPVQHDDDDCSNDDFSPLPLEDDETTQPTSNVHPLSFDLEEEESQLQRYRLSPSPSATTGTSERVFSQSNTLSLSTCWQRYLELRVEHGRRRAEQLLSMNEDSWREHFCLTWDAYTNLLTTRGVLLHILLLLGWLLACHFHKRKRSTLLAVGFLGLFLRLSWRPCYWYIWEQPRIEQQRHETMAIYNGSSSSWNHDGDELHDNDHDAEEEEEITTSIV